LVRIPSKEVDVILDPLKGEPHIVYAGIQNTGFSNFGRREETKRPQSVGDCYGDVRVIVGVNLLREVEMTISTAISTSI
jgi:hypothetical protein